MESTRRKILNSPSTKLYTNSIPKNLLGILSVKYPNPGSTLFLFFQIIRNKFTVLLVKYSIPNPSMLLRFHFQKNHHQKYNFWKIHSNLTLLVRYLLDIQQKFTIFQVLIYFFWFFRLLQKSTLFEFFPWILFVSITVLKLRTTRMTTKIFLHRWALLWTRIIFMF